MSSDSGQQRDRSWFIYGHEKPKERLRKMLSRLPPSWRDFENEGRRSAYEFQIDAEAQEVVNAAIYLRRPLLITGPPGTGKSSLAYSIASQLGLGQVLEWPITSRSTLQDALYQYDAIGRLQAVNLARGKGENGQVDAEEAAPIGDFLTLGPLGTALADSKEKPRVLLIDEIDKSDIDLPNDLLFLFEEGKFEIPELVRLTGAHKWRQGKERTRKRFEIRKHGVGAEDDSGTETVEATAGDGNDAETVEATAGDGNDAETVEATAGDGNDAETVEATAGDSDGAETVEATAADGNDAETVEIIDGKVSCRYFPIVVMTSNGEREMPAPFLRRCLRLEMKQPNEALLRRIVAAHFEGNPVPAEVTQFIRHIDEKRGKGELVATDQLMNAVYLAQQILMENRGEGQRQRLTEEERATIQEIVLRAISRTG